jgi:DNA-binding transcriptional LysR family regulator
MDLKQIRAFLTIAETGSVTRAAEILHVVQPAVSRQLKLLEEELGVALFERDRNGMLLTEAGRLLSERSGRALRELDSVRLELRPARGALSGEVRIGLLPGSCELVAAALTKAAQAQHPGIRITLTVGFTDDLTQGLEDGELDAALLYDPRESSRITSTPLLTEPLWICGAPSVQLRQDEPVGLDILGRYPVVLPSRRHGLRTLVEHACAVGNVSLNVAAETNALAVHKELVIHGLGVTVIPRVGIRNELASDLLCAAPIHHAAFLRRLAIALSTARRISPAAQYVTDTLVKCIASAVRSGAWLDATLLGEHPADYAGA